MARADGVGDGTAVGAVVGRSVGKVVGCASDVTTRVLGTSLGAMTGAVVGDECAVCVSKGSVASVGAAEDEALQPLNTRNISNSERILAIIVSCASAQARA